MKINLTVEIDGTDSQVEEILDNLELAATEGEGVTVRTAGGTFLADVIDVAEAP